MSDIPPPTEPGSEPLPQPEPATRDELLELALLDLRERRAALLSEIEGLEQRRRQLETDLNGSLSGRADGIARRLKGFQDYLVVALQDLASQAELMDLVVQPLQVQPSPLDPVPEAPAAASMAAAAAVQQIPPAAAGQFSQDAELIRDRLTSFQGQPDFYADPWKLRRSLEPAAAALLDDWFLNQGGRGAQASTGSRNRNALITAGAVAILGDLYGDRFQTLVLAGEPERLGEWRRGLQDCLGLAREDFGPNSGIVLFERPDALIERADRLEERGELPFIVIDAAEQVVDIPVLQFPLWLAFAATANELALEQDLP
ncbi:DUF3086 domain-containing protein [Synechococcus sp. CBW1107]|uniref:DUF3086 domain-containing protein n=1 Tax=Synechococcus sp. CBW1107 TaxID=2789857 RepID=UPI002AD51C3E|nr:DUF3086 domain-containing protein [Synechococcus sp. CBW1107]CAK6698718.1 hypothetical protein ICNINCKA_02495 [Synechococcus sp. CBW1107]